MSTTSHKVTTHLPLDVIGDITEVIHDANVVVSFPNSDIYINLGHHTSDANGIAASIMKEHCLPGSEDRILDVIIMTAATRSTSIARKWLIYRVLPATTAITSMAVGLSRGQVRTFTTPPGSD